MLPTVLWIIIALLAIVYVIMAIIQISPNERWVKERLSQYQETLGAWWNFIIPFVDTVKKVDMRERVINTPPQEMITRDNAVVVVDAIIFAQITEPYKAIYEIQDAFLAISSLSATELRSIIGTMSLDEVLGERSKINTKVQVELSEETAKRWVSINKLEIQHIDPPQKLMDAMNEQKIAEQQKKAAILKAEGEKEAAIREAEWEKEAAIRASEWERESQIIRAEWFKEKQVLEAEGQALALERMALAKAKALELESIAAVEYFKWPAVIQEQLKVVEKALGNNTKWVMDTDLLGVIKNFIPWMK